MSVLRKKYEWSVKMIKNIYVYSYKSRYIIYTYKYTQCTVYNIQCKLCTYFGKLGYENFLPNA